MTSTRFNPLFGNPFRSRADFENAVVQLIAPLRLHASVGNARVKLSAPCDSNDGIELEGFARPLFALAALGRHQSKLPWHDEYIEGLSNGIDPRHPEFWGWPRDHDQRLVEAAPIAFALLLAPQHFLDPLSMRAKGDLLAWLKAVAECRFYDNNWIFFEALVLLALRRLGAEPPRSPEDCIRRIDRFYEGRGWYKDGNANRYDLYVPSVFHTFALMYSRLNPSDEEQCARFHERAREFFVEFADWVPAAGPVLPFGRSLSNRFGHQSFFSALAFAGVDGIDWPRARGLLAGPLRWWAEQPCFSRDGILEPGFAYVNPRLAESYTSHASAYGGMTLFLALATEPSHPIWSAEEVEPAPPAGVTTQSQPKCVIYGDKTHTVALFCGQDGKGFAAGDSKYSKLAYSTYFGFSVDDSPAFDGNTFDSQLAVSFDRRTFSLRGNPARSFVHDGIAFSLWGLSRRFWIETWLIAEPPWHIRVHRVSANWPLLLTEGGFAIADLYRDVKPDMRIGSATAVNASDWSVIVDIGSSVARQGHCRASHRTNVFHARTMAPHLLAEVGAASTEVLVSAVTAGRGGAPPPEPPAAPDIQRLFELRDRYLPKDGD